MKKLLLVLCFLILGGCSLDYVEVWIPTDGTITYVNEDVDDGNRVFVVGVMVNVHHADYEIETTYDRQVDKGDYRPCEYGFTKKKRKLRIRCN